MARRDEARVLARACLISGLVVSVALLVPFSPTARRGLGLAIVVLALGLSAALYHLGNRLRSWHLHAVLGVASGCVAVSVATASIPNATLVTSVAYLWIVTFSAVFHRRPVLLRHLAGMAVGLGVGLWLAEAPSAAQTWFVLTATFGGVALVLNSRVVELRREATTDPLTGVLTRRAFEYAAELETTRATRTGRPLTLAVLDLDDFKAINDQDGHAAGVLSLLRSDLCEWSAGVAPWEGQDLAGWFAAADRDLYAAKQGR